MKTLGNWNLYKFDLAVRGIESVLYFEFLHLPFEAKWPIFTFIGQVDLLYPELCIRFLQIFFLINACLRQR